MTAKGTRQMLMDDHQPTLLNINPYNRLPELDFQEQEALAQAVAFCTGDNETRLPEQLNLILARLVQPLKDILTRLRVSPKYCSAPIQLILQEMHARSTSYWAWSEEVWATLLARAFARFRHDYSPQTYRRVRFQLMMVAYVIGPQTDFFLPLLGDISPLAFAAHLFGKEPLQSSVEQLRTALSGWGYDYGDPSKQRCLATTIAEIMLVNRSPLLEQITFARLVCLRPKMKPYQ